MATAVCDALWGSIPIITLHDCLLGRVGNHGGTPACRLFVLDPLLSHTVAKPERELFDMKASRLCRRQALRESSRKDL